MNKYKVKVYKTVVHEFLVDIYANSEEDIKKIVNDSPDADDIINTVNTEDTHFEDSIYDQNLSDICDWEWMLNPYNDDVIEETYELGKIDLKDENKNKRQQL